MNWAQPDLYGYWYDVGCKTARKETIDEVLEIVSELKNDNIGGDGSDEYTSACDDFRAAVEAMKGGWRRAR